MTSTLISNPDQVTSEWLQSVLQPHVQITSFSKTSSQPFGTATVRIEVAYARPVPHLPTRFLLKIDGPGSLAGGREVEFYTRFGRGPEMGATVRCFDAVYDESQCAYHVLLEDLTDTHFMIEREAPPTQAEAERMIDSLAVLHGHRWEKVDSTVPLVDDALLNAPVAYFAPFVDYMGERLTEKRRRVYERILESLPTLLRERLIHDLTLVHDDAHAWNFLHPRAPEKDQTVLLDWQQWGRSIGVHDVAYHMSLFWYPDLRQRMEQAMIRRYHDGLLRQGVSGYSFETLQEDYRLFVMRNMLVPLWAFHHGHWAPHRWMQMEKGWFAFNDLDCIELLD